MRLIDADKLISSLGWLVESGMTGNKTKAVIKLAIQTADGQPTVDAELVKHGWWVNKGFEPLRCSVCGITVDAINGVPWAIKSFNYCPHCGAKMDEVET